MNAPIIDCASYWPLGTDRWAYEPYTTNVVRVPLDKEGETMPIKLTTGDLTYFTVSAELITRHKIKKVIFNPPATVVIWDDRSKTVVKCKEGDTYDKWTGLALCISKKYLGDNFHKTFNAWCREEKEYEQTI